VRVFTGDLARRFQCVLIARAQGDPRGLVGFQTGFRSGFIEHDGVDDGFDVTLQQRPHHRTPHPEERQRQNQVTEQFFGQCDHGGVAPEWRFGFGWQGFGALVLTSFLMVLSGIDFKTGYLPDALTLPLMWLGLVASLDNLYMPAKPALLGVVVGYASLWTVWWLFRQLTGKDGMGHGDFKLLAALGAWCGLQGVLPVILISSFLGLIFGSLWLLVKGKTRATPIPFGPYLAVAGWIFFMWNAPLMALYWQILGGLGA